MVRQLINQKLFKICRKECVSVCKRWKNSPKVKHETRTNKLSMQRNIQTCSKNTIRLVQCKILTNSVIFLNQNGFFHTEFKFLRLTWFMYRKSIRFILAFLALLSTINSYICQIEVYKSNISISKLLRRH